MMRVLRLVLLAALTLMIGAFHGFVGWHKAFSPLEELVRNSAWTVHLPDWLGKMVGWLEMALVAVLLVALLRPALARAGVAAGIGLIALEAVAAFTHYVTRDGGSLAQNAVSIGLTGLMAWLYATRPMPLRP